MGLPHDENAAAFCVSAGMLREELYEKEEN